MNKITKLALSAVVAVSALGTTVYAEGETATQNSADEPKLTTATETTTSKDEATGVTVSINAQEVEGAEVVWELDVETATASKVTVDITPYVVDGTTKTQCGTLFAPAAQTVTVTLPSSWTAAKATVTHDTTGKVMTGTDGATPITVNNGTVTFVVPAGEGYSPFTITAAVDNTAKTNTNSGKAVPNTSVK